MKKYYIILFLFLCLNISINACERCTAIYEYVLMNESWDVEHQGKVVGAGSQYWYLEGRISAWDEIKYMEVP